MAARKYDYEKYLGSSHKLKKFLDSYKTKYSTYKSYRTHLVRYFEHMDIADVDSYVNDTRMMDKKQKIKYLDGLEEDLFQYWAWLNVELTGKGPYGWISAMKMFLIYNKTFEMDDVFVRLQKNGHGNYTVTNTKTPTKQQLLRIFSYSNPESKALFMFQLCSGQRLEQVLATTMDNIDLSHELPRIHYHTAKQKSFVKTRITPECKQLLQEYLEQQDKFIQTRLKRGAHCRKKKLDTTKLFPMTEGTANTIWTTMLKNAGLYELDPITKRPVYGTHCLRRYFLNHFTDDSWGDYFSGHVTPRNREYRQYSDERLDKEYRENMAELIIFESKPDLTEVTKEIKFLKQNGEDKDHKIQNLMDELRKHKELVELLVEQLKNDKSG